MSLSELPAGLPVPVDDGGADHLLGSALPEIELPTAQGGTLNLARAGSPWLVLYVYPMTGRPDVALPDGRRSRGPAAAHPRRAPFAITTMN